MTDQVIFRTTEQKKKLVRILAARAGYMNTSEYLNALIEKEIAKLSSQEMATLLGETASPKGSSGRRARDQVAK